MRVPQRLGNFAIFHNIKKNLSKGENKFAQKWSPQAKLVVPRNVPKGRTSRTRGPIYPTGRIRACTPKFMSSLKAPLQAKVSARRRGPLGSG